MPCPLEKMVTIQNCVTTYSHPLTAEHNNSKNLIRPITCFYGVQRRGTSRKTYSAVVVCGPKEVQFLIFSWPIRNIGQSHVPFFAKTNWFCLKNQIRTLFISKTIRYTFLCVKLRQNKRSAKYTHINKHTGKGLLWSLDKKRLKCLNDHTSPEIILRIAKRVIFRLFGFKYL